MRKRFLVFGLIFAMLLMVQVLSGCASPEEETKKDFAEWLSGSAAEEAEADRFIREEDREALFFGLSALEKDDLSPAEAGDDMEEKFMLQGKEHAAVFYGDADLEQVCIGFDDNFWNVEDETVRNAVTAVFETWSKNTFSPGTPRWEKYVKGDTEKYAKEIAERNGGSLESLEGIPVGTAAENDSVWLWYVGDSVTPRADRTIMAMEKSGKDGWRFLGETSDKDVKDRFGGDYRNAAEELWRETVLSSEDNPAEV